jgi:hypothetical protein
MGRLIFPADPFSYIPASVKFRAQIQCETPPPPELGLLRFLPRHLRKRDKVVAPLHTNRDNPVAKADRYYCISTPNPHRDEAIRGLNSSAPVPPYSIFIGSDPAVMFPLSNLK